MKKKQHFQPYGHQPYPKFLHYSNKWEIGRFTSLIFFCIFCIYYKKNKEFENFKSLKIFHEI